jgi:superfamily II DNA/RNA helicase
MHGNKSQSQRRRALASFEAGTVDTLVATDVAARGIDVEEITHVINFDAPEDRDAYVHRTGRTARAGATGIAASFVVPDQHGEMRQIAHELGLHSEFESAPAHGPGPGGNGPSGRRNGRGSPGGGNGRGPNGRGPNARNGNRRRARGNGRRR